jgi:ubiquinone/menaquinone biosynthesis C-methylase UbiE
VVGDMSQTRISEPTTWARRELDQAAAYDAIGIRYDEAFPHKEGQIACVDQLLANLRRGARVLDVGCGTGLPTARQLADADLQVTCIDISPRMLDVARGTVPEARFLQLDMVDLDPMPGQFEAVVAFFSLLNLPRSRFAETLRLIRRVLVPGGWFAYGMVEADLDDVPVPFLGQDIRVSGYPRAELRAEVEKAGFAHVWDRALSYAPRAESLAPEMDIYGLCHRVDDTGTR